MNEKIKKVNKIIQNYKSICGILYTSKEINQETKERGKTMKKKIVYVAYDGEQFPTECACAEYELSMNVHRFAKDFSLYGKDRKPIPNDVSWDSEDIYFIRIINPSEELNMYLEKRLTEYGIESPCTDYDLEFKDDLYFFDDINDCWRSWSDEMEKLELMGEHFQMFTEN